MVMEIPDWHAITPEAMRSFSEDDLLDIMSKNPGGVYDAWAKAELERRQILSLREATQEVHEQVASLTASSTKLEGLTTTLKNLTWALIFLTIFAVGTPIGIEIWKAFHEPQSVPASAPP
jgi:hypothetical protein